MSRIILPADAAAQTFSHARRQRQSNPYLARIVTASGMAIRVILRHLIVANDNGARS